MTNLLSKLKQGVQQATTTSSSTGTNAAATATATAYSASHPPRYVYKLLDATNPRFTGFPVPIPSSWQVPVTELDAKDGFMHLSTEQQIQGTLDRFFNPTKGLNRVTVLKMEYDRLSAWKVVKWEHSGSGGRESRARFFGDKSAPPRPGVES